MNFFVRWLIRYDNLLASKNHVTYGRMRADVFAICMSYEKESELSELSYRFRKEIREIIPEFEMIPVFGFYLTKI